ncbi:hypothetical protein PNK_1213 [Candidatus Protochlamydia naegleriophila]|uniref:MORN repeat-containing protein n=1 Tax=Candidatus Protochlamydia naegleriophila TaxID=389348 RepID=A0A0U5JBP0_9BACT|nr:hypothetical protein [Candidatus Protochlamydia naegleriophila]CUI16830.1 hypothetical protein PNK_1213 [Candidatus Protochlamydia naegleriophila]
MFKGIFKDDQIFDGVYTCRNGLTYTGQFENGRLIQGTTYKKINDSTRRHSSIKNYTISGKNCLSKIPKPKKIASDNSTVSSKQIVFKNYIPSQTNNP